MSAPERGPLWVNQALFDRLILADDGDPVGMVDDLELTDMRGELRWTAILCGPMALGPRIGDRIGTWWLSVGRRLRPRDDPAPVRIPVTAIRQLDRGEVALNVPAEETGTLTLRRWVDDKIIKRIPGSGA